MKRSFLFLSALALLSAIILSCSFSPLGKQRVTIFPPDSWRSGPPIATMSHYALTVSGGLPNSLRTGDVGGRSLTCLGFAGSVNFPYSYSQVIAGVSLSLSPGTYSFRFIGFSESAVLAPSSVGQIFASSPSLKAFVLAQATGTVTSGSQFKATSSYVETSASDLIAACPPLSNGLHFGYRVNNELHYVSNTSGSWVDQSALVGTTLGDTHLFVSDDGKAHFTHSDNYAPYGVRYLSNKTGSFVGSQVVSPTVTESNDNSDIVVDSRGNLFVMHNRRNVNIDPELSINDGLGWTMVGPAFVSTSSNYFDFRLAISGNESLLAAATELVSGGAIRAAVRNPSGAWGVAANLKTAGANTCSDIGKATVAFDGASRPHFIFLCNSGGTNYIGYANFNLGSWVSFAVQLVGAPSPQYLALSIDGGGKMHMAYGSDGGLFYALGETTGGTWNMSTQVGTSPLNFSGIEIIGNSADDVKILTLENPGGGSVDAFLYNREGSSFTKNPVATLPVGAVLSEGFYQR